MSRVILVLVVVAVAAGAWWLLDQDPADRATVDLDAGLPAPELPAGAEEPQAPATAEELAAEIEAQGRDYVAEISAPTIATITAREADHFISPQQSIALQGELPSETITKEALAERGDLSPDSPITIVRHREQVEFQSPVKIVQNAGGDLDRGVRVMADDDTVREMTVAEVVDEYGGDTDTRLRVVTTTTELEVRSVESVLADESIAADAEIEVIFEPYKLRTTTIAEIYGTEDLAVADSIFYVKTVETRDEQGIWGIVQRGLTENFAQGIALKRGESVDVYQVAIPEEADERTAENATSFLGKVIHSKSAASHVYNFAEGRMGSNPDLILPGQELLIIRFTSDELISVYQHFVANAAEG